MQKKNPLQRKHHEIDATGKSIGRVASEAVRFLRGKNKPSFEFHLDEGDFVTVSNISKANFTGKKLVQKDYYHHTMYPGGIVRTPMKKLFETKPGNVMERAVYRMLPKNKLRDAIMKRLTLKA